MEKNRGSLQMKNILFFGWKNDYKVYIIYGSQKTEFIQEIYFQKLWLFCLGHTTQITAHLTPPKYSVGVGFLKYCVLKSPWEFKYKTKKP